MRPRTKTQLSLTLIISVTMCVSAASGAAQSNPPVAKPSAKSGARVHHVRSSRKSRRVKGQKAPEANRISEIQTALARDGSFSGAPNGKWDDATVAAMKKYQESHGLNPTGKLDAKTLQSLGLGSQTAGAAPPTPPVSSSSLATSPQPSAPRKQ